MRTKLLLQAPLVFISLVSAINFTHAQTGNLKGSISTSNGKVAPYVNILVKESGKGTVSSETGTYSINGLKPGDYTVVISFTGLKTIEEAVKISGSETIVRDFTLEETSANCRK
jgi:iron complex outermembrane receptor protein